MKKQNRKSWTMAYCGMAAALCVALMLLGAVIPIAMFIAPALAGVSDRDSVCGVRAHHGAHSLRGGQPAGAFVCAGQRSGPDLRVPAGVLPAGKTPVRPHPPGRAAVRVQAAAVQRRRAGYVRPAAGAHPGGQHLTGAAHHGVDSYPVHAGHGQCGLLLYDRALHNLLMLYRLVWQPKLHRMLGMH